MKKYRSLLIFIITTTSVIVLYLWTSKHPIVATEAVNETSASSASSSVTAYINNIDRIRTQSALQHSSSSLIEKNYQSSVTPETIDLNFSKLSNEQFRSLIEKYSHGLPKTTGKTKLRSGGDSNGDSEDLKKRAYEGDPGAQFLYAKRLSLSLLKELSKEDIETKGHADIPKWLEKHEEARNFLIASAIATGNGSAMAHLGVIYGLAPISDNVEALAWSMISQDMGYEGMINICVTSINPCTTDQFLNAHTRAKNYLILYSFDVEK